ncbi:unnamed protein product [Adineta steineri]|uniref:Uncharacterized protein n=1 Tax=Adineta steineri TaxID=433720 RepID=A0A815K9H3_9BILA|nr:unnamed protein product [Adineta steineri]CAF4118145.1 unnamed protein product [Adineta steineri]
MAIYDKLSFLLILCFCGLIMHLCSGYALPSGDCSKDEDSKKQLDDSCIGKNEEGEESAMCNEYCSRTRTIDSSQLPSLLQQLGQVLFNNLRLGCVGYCSQEQTCLCVIGSDVLYEGPGDIDVAGINPEKIIFFTTLNIGGKNVSVSNILCENPN